MSMTREEAIALFEKQLTAAQVVLDSGFGSNPGENSFLYRRRKEMAEIALSALRPITRKRVEKMFSGCPACNDQRCTSCWCFGRYGEVCRKCENQSGYQPLKFCPHCGKPLRDEAVDMVMERLEALRGDR